MSGDPRLTLIDSITSKYIRRARGKPENRTPVKCVQAKKLKYETRTKADRCAAELKRVLNEPVLQRSYKCPYSGNPKKPHWHLTSKPERVD